MIHFFGILDPMLGKTGKTEQEPGKKAFFGPPPAASSQAARLSEREDLEDAARERQRFLLQSFSPQF